MSLDNEELRLIEIKQILSQFDYTPGKTAWQLEGRWFVQQRLYHVHVSTSESRKKVFYKHFERFITKNENGTWACPDCEETASDFVQLWANLNLRRDNWVTG